VFERLRRNYLTGQPHISEQLREVHHATLLADKRLLEVIQGRTGSFRVGEEFTVSADVAALRAQRIIEDMVAAERGWLGRRACAKSTGSQDGVTTNGPERRDCPGRLLQRQGHPKIVSNRLARR
jgi:vanillate O-demethylase oxygenase-like protein